MAELSAETVPSPEARMGSLFAGYEGLGAGVQSVLGGSLAWYSEIDAGALKILGHRFPHVPNLGDVTTVDWESVQPVDILTGGSPCQDLSAAGKRAGMTEGTRSNLWVAMREAIAVLRPSVVVWENVRGAFSAAADSEVEPCPGCVGDGSGVHLRALGRVLGDLSDLGYDTSWHGLRAADVGAPHNRFRVFVVATYADRGRSILLGGQHAEQRHVDGCDRANGSWSPSEPATCLLTSPRTSDTNGAGQHGDGGLDLRTAVTLLPTPRASDGTKGGPNQRGSSGDLMLPSAVHQMLPTPRTQDAKANASPSELDRKSPGLGAVSALLPTPMVGSTSPASHGQISGQYRRQMSEAFESWGDYAPAIRQWEGVTRPAPKPTVINKKGNAQLSATFAEWLMGVPEGWITDVPGITRNEALKACGNGVVPQQAAEAVHRARAFVAREVAS